MEREKVVIESEIKIEIEGAKEWESCKKTERKKILENLFVEDQPRVFEIPSIPRDV